MWKRFKELLALFLNKTGEKWGGEISGACSEKNSLKEILWIKKKKKKRNGLKRVEKKCKIKKKSSHPVVSVWTILTQYVHDYKHESDEKSNGSHARKEKRERFVDRSRPDNIAVNVPHVTRCTRKCYASHANVCRDVITQTATHVHNAVEVYKIRIQQKYIFLINQIKTIK